MSKIVVCRCEDVTLADLEHSVARGFKDLEEVKRFTGFGTGPCQGKECLRVVAVELQRLTGQTPAPFTVRPPIVPTPLKMFVNDPCADTSEDEIHPPEED
jgi:bacterioferritin-associated ferredoxin